MSDCPLSPAEVEVLRQLARGLTYEEIARERSHAAATVRTQVHSMIATLGVVDRARAAVKAAREGWIAFGPRGESAQLARVERPICDLIDVVRRRLRRKRITWLERAYLDRLDAYIRAPSRERAAAVREADEALQRALAYRDLTLEGGRLRRPELR